MRVIVTGATGMVGEGVLHECLLHPDVERVLVVGRRPCGVKHGKLKEIVHADLYDLSPVASELAGYDACYYCLGVSSVGMSEADYARVTHDLTLHAAELLARLNPGLVFCYVTGTGTDSSERGRSMWARVKGRTENALLRLPFKRAYMFRPGYIHPTKGLKNTHKYYRAFMWLYPVLRLLMPGGVVTLRELGLAMIRAARADFGPAILGSREIRELARQGE
ncbi:NAD-dependent epimerase/dehydratase family protein [Paenibacillus sp. MWE-103]|uniref:NAD-dependent epimerase/dehydratase family protein n=1 Tax=Paenibacillus artemisiicola TaxID=1172618 RepID=A0ABS3WEN7_9BACL|nr:NAD-dependent epimerase/dehydratase family protein [Paenibacillus artemisiicola]MBO7746791.1 NAD-dependent epimerase/dehydratase family protein [Paenibacillus artemisiicola]